DEGACQSRHAADLSADHDLRRLSGRAASVYTAGRPTPAPGPARKPGPKTRHSDGEIIEAIRAILAACPFQGEGYRKVRARLAHREAGRSLGPRAHFARASAMPSGRFSKDVARGLALRCDWGPQYLADAWINEVKWLGCTISPSYVDEPECNGVAERFMRTLKEQCIYLHQFESLEEARGIIGEFIVQYNTEWLIERLGHRTPVQARADSLARVA